MVWCGAVDPRSRQRKRLSSHKQERVQLYTLSCLCLVRALSTHSLPTTTTSCFFLSPALALFCLSRVSSLSFPVVVQDCRLPFPLSVLLV